MKVLKIFALSLISLMLVFTGWIYMAGIAVERTVLSSAFYHDLMDNTDVSSNLHEMLQETMLEGLKMEQVEQEMQEDLPDGKIPEEVMPEGFIELIFGALGDAYHAEWLEEQMLVVIDDALALIKGKQDSLTAIINMREGKERFKEALAISIEEFPMDDSTPKMTDSMVEEIVADMELPDEFVLADLLNNSEELDEKINKAQLYRGYFQVVPYILFAVFLLLSIILAKLPGGLKWFGAVALFSGITFFIVLKGAKSFLNSNISAILEDGPPIEPEVILSATELIFTRITAIPLLFAAFGLALLAGGVIMGKRKLDNSIRT